MRIKKPLVFGTLIVAIGLALFMFNGLGLTPKVWGQVQCTTDANCPAGQFCYNYQCHTPECQNDADCGPDYFCYLRLCYEKDDCQGVAAPDITGVCQGQTCSGSPPDKDCVCNCWPQVDCNQTCIRKYCSNEICNEYKPPYCRCTWSCPPAGRPSPTPKFQPTATPTPTSTPRLTPTNTPTPSLTPTPSPTPTSSPTPTPSPTATPLPTPTSTPVPTATPLPTSTPTPVPTATPTREPPASCACWSLEAEGKPNLGNVKRGQLLTFLAEAYVSTPQTAKVLDMVFVLQRPGLNPVESGPMPAYFNRSQIINGVNTDVYRSSWAYRVQATDPEGLYHLELIIHCGWKEGAMLPGQLVGQGQPVQFRVLGQTIPTPTSTPAQTPSAFQRWLNSLLEFLGLRRPEAARVVEPGGAETLKLGTFYPTPVLPEGECVDLYFYVKP